MNIRRSILVLAWTAAPLVLTAVQPGDTRETVIAELGHPTGSAAVGDRTILFFDRGEVQLAANRVVAVNLVSADEIAARDAAATAARQRSEATTRARLERLEAEGRAIHAAKKVDPAFAALPAEEQLRYWRAFAARYPMIAVTAEITPLVAIVEDDLRRRELAAAAEDRLAALEQRVAVAEARAAEVAEDNRPLRYTYSGFPYRRHYHAHAPRPPVEAARPTPPLHPVDAARANAMAESEAARQRAYTGGTR